MTMIRPAASGESKPAPNAVSLMTDPAPVMDTPTPSPKAQASFVGFHELFRSLVSGRPVGRARLSQE